MKVIRDLTFIPGSLKYVLDAFRRVERTKIVKIGVCNRIKVVFIIFQGPLIVARWFIGHRSLNICRDESDGESTGQRARMLKRK